MPPGLTNVCSCAPAISIRYERDVMRCSHAAQTTASSSVVVTDGAVEDCSLATADVYHRAMLRFALIVLVLAGCKKTPPRFEGPLRVELGDCSDATVWVSGPRPAPLEERVAKTGDEPAKVASNDPDEGGEGAFASLTGTGDISSGFDDKNIYGDLLGTENSESTGWGTIGTGRYGTIGTGAGTRTGYGPGGMRGRRANAPTIQIGQAVATGDLDKAIIRRYIKRNIQKIQYCYEKQLIAKPNLAGVVQTEFFILPDGKVSSSKATGVDADVSQCIAGVIKGIEFPRPKGGGGVQVMYPFTLHPIDDGTTGRGMGTGVTSATPVPGAGSDQPKADPKPVPPPKPAKPRYVAGAASPLAPQLPALEECFRANPQPYGVATVKLTATGAEVQGVQGDVAKCVVDAVKTLSSAKPQVCSIAFGTMPIAELPAVEITADAIKYGGASIADPKKEVEPAALKFKIDALFDRIEAAVKRDRAITTPVSVIGPLVVRPIDSTPIEVVAKVTTSILAADGDYVLAAAKGNEWRFLHDVTAPVVPVPLGTGAGWATKQSKSRTDEERVRISILVQKDQIWVGLSRINEFYQIPALPSKEPDWDKLEMTLKEQKRTAFLVDRSDIDIAGEGVTYGDIVKTIDLAIKTGFIDFTFTHSANLAARPTL